MKYILVMLSEVVVPIDPRGLQQLRLILDIIVYNMENIWLQFCLIINNGMICVQVMFYNILIECVSHLYLCSNVLFRDYTNTIDTSWFIYIKYRLDGNTKSASRINIYVAYVLSSSSSWKINLKTGNKLHT